MLGFCMQAYQIRNFWMKSTAMHHRRTSIFLRVGASTIISFFSLPPRVHHCFHGPATSNREGEAASSPFLSSSKGHFHSLIIFACSKRCTWIFSIGSLVALSASLLSQHINFANGSKSRSSFLLECSHQKH